jgi:hypothetical protein
MLLIYCLFGRIELFYFSHKGRPHSLHSLRLEHASCSIKWLPFQSALIALEDILSKLLAPIGLLFPTYTPILVGLMLGCTALASRLHLGFGGNGR